METDAWPQQYPPPPPPPKKKKKMLIHLNYEIWNIITIDLDFTWYSTQELRLSLKPNVQTFFLSLLSFFHFNNYYFFTNLRSVSPVSSVAAIFTLDALRALNTLDASNTLYTLVTEEKGWCDADFFRISLVVSRVELGLEQGWVRLK